MHEQMRTDLAEDFALHVLLVLHVRAYAACDRAGMQAYARMWSTVRTRERIPRREAWHRVINNMV